MALAPIPFPCPVSALLSIRLLNRGPGFAFDIPGFLIQLGGGTQGPTLSFTA